MSFNRPNLCKNLRDKSKRYKMKWTKLMNSYYIYKVNAKISINHLRKASDNIRLSKRGENKMRNLKIRRIQWRIGQIMPIL